MIGILKNNIVNSDKDFFAIKNLNELVNTRTNNCLFCNGIDPTFILNVRTNVLQKSFAHTFNGVIITDELEGIEDLINISYAQAKFLYLYRLEWMNLKNISYSDLKKGLLNNNIELIARNKQHADIIEQLFKKPKYVMPEWDYHTLIEIDNNEK
tara:strand:- start:685 stop:1146 length:462 start_codon:yes stop_codon:yes gene_type:complete